MSLFRQFVAPVLLAVFGTVTFLGTGLHLLPGCGHSHGLGHFCSADGDACDHVPQSPTSEIGASNSDCAICRFLAIPQALTPPLKVIAYGVRCEPMSEEAILQPSIEGERLYSARAPPRLSSNV